MMDREIPAEYFAVIKNQRTGSIVASGWYSEMADIKDSMNLDYQTDDYVVELWKEQS